MNAVWRFDPVNIDYEGWRDRLRRLTGMRDDGRIDENIICDMLILLSSIERGEHLMQEGGK